MTNHPIPIAPSNSQIRQWHKHLFKDTVVEEDHIAAVFTEIFQAGADQELEACCEWIHNETSDDGFIANLRSARRRTLLSLKQEGLDQLDSVQGLLTMKGLRSDAIRCALEALPDD